MTVYLNRSGGKTRTVRSTAELQPKLNYVNYNELVREVTKLANDDPELVRVVNLQPRTDSNRSIIALELRSDKNSIKPGILVFGGRIIRYYLLSIPFRPIYPEHKLYNYLIVTYIM